MLAYEFQYRSFKTILSRRIAMRRPWSRSPTVLIPAAVIFLGGVALLFVFVERWTAEEPNWSLIEEGLYQGGLVSKPPPGTQAVLNLCESEDSYQCEIHRWQAIRDASPAPSLEWLQQQVAFVDGQRQAGRTVFVYCLAGNSRSGMVVTAYLMQEHNWTRDEALAFARGKRPLTWPNPAFMKLLSEWERTLRRGEP